MDEEQSKKSKATWLVTAAALSFVFNAVATISAAMSAYYTGKQSELAMEAVNRQSRNEAFARFLAAKEALCKVSLTTWDQMDGLDYSGDYISLAPQYNALLLSVDYDDIMVGHGKERTEEYVKRALAAAENLNSALKQLSIWVSDEEYSEYSSLVYSPDDLTYRLDYLLSAGQMAELTAVATQYQCRRDMEYELRLYRGTLGKDDYERVSASIVIPLSNTRGIEEIIRSWGTGGESEWVIEELKKRGVIKVID